MKHLFGRVVGQTFCGLSLRDADAVVPALLHEATCATCIADYDLPRPPDLRATVGQLLSALILLLDEHTDCPSCDTCEPGHQAVLAARRALEALR